MRDFGKVYSRIWQSEDFRALCEDGRTMVLYLLTCPHATLIGCWRLSEAYAADDLQWPLERVQKGFEELIAKGFMTREEGSQWVFIHKFLLWNQFENPNVAKSAEKMFDKVSLLAYKSLLVKAFLEFAPHLSEGFRKRLQTLAEEYRKPEPEPEPNQSLSQNPSQATARLQPPAAGKGSRQAKARDPKATDAQGKAPAALTWDYYSAAYSARYHHAPEPNATIRGLLAHFVTRVPAAEAPDVAAFYVQNNSLEYVKSRHSVKLLIRDAEKHLGEWRTGQQLTSTQALQADRTQANASAFDGPLREALAREAQERGEVEVFHGE